MFAVLILAWLPLAFLWYLNAAGNIIPTRNYAAFSQIASILIGLAIYKINYSNIKELTDKIGNKFKRIIMMVLVPIFIVFLVRIQVFSVLPYLFSSFGTIPHEEILTVQGRDFNRRSPCRRNIIFKEYNELLYGGLCIDKKIFLLENTGGKMKLIGKRNALAFYVSDYFNVDDEN